MVASDMDLRACHLGLSLSLCVCVSHLKFMDGSWDSLRRCPDYRRDQQREAHLGHCIGEEFRAWLLAMYPRVYVRLLALQRAASLG